MKPQHSINTIMILCIIASMTIGFFVGGELILAIYTKRVSEVVRRNDKTHEDYGRDGPYWSAGEPAEGDRRVNAIIWATRKAAPGVVGIVVTQIQMVRGPYRGNYFFDYFFAPDASPLKYRKIENVGSGFVISEDGMILTNYHVVHNASKLHVNFPDGRRIDARIVGADEKSDIAVIAVDGSGFKAVPLGNSDRCLTGEWSIALGNPFLNFINDASPTVTVGVISALNRNFAPTEGVYYQGMIQTDAAINPGNSGGPLINTRGEVIGINAFIYTGGAGHAGSIGIGFAIPINRARRVVEELIAHGRRRQVWTGISVQNIHSPIAMVFNIDNPKGVVVTNIRQQSPGEAAGLKSGDIIYRMDNLPIHSDSDLDGLFLDYYVGDTVSVHFLRNAKQMRAELILKEYPKRKK